VVNRKNDITGENNIRKDFTELVFSEAIESEDAAPDKENFPLGCPCCVRQEQPANRVLLDFNTVLADEICRANKVENV
jgi:hypothetical protein